MSLKEKYDALSIQTRAAIRTAVFISSVIAFMTFAICAPWLFFPMVMFGALGFLCYTLYRLNLSILESRERYKK